MAKQKILIIVESPKKIDTILKYVPKENEYIILASNGHIADLSQTGKHHLGIDLEDNFKLHYVLNADKKEKLAAIINACTVCDKILLACDNDREGHVISSLIADRIKTCGKPIKRIVFDEITKAGVLKGLSNESDINENAVNAGKSRRALDRLVGFLGSPFIIKRLGSNMSAGRVQSVALKLVVEREKEIQAFKPEEYWSIKVNLQKFAEEPFFASLYSKDYIPNEEEATKLKNELDKASYKVSKIVAKPKKKYPYPPLNTAKLQMASSSRFRVSPAKTMAAAQELYEKGLITYMRTDSVRLSDEALAQVREWIKGNYPSCLPDKPNYYKNKDAAQNAHEAIRPSNVNTLPEKVPQTDTEKVYRVIWDSFVTCQMTPAIYDTTAVTIATDNNRELRANGRMLTDPGWLIINSNFDDNDEKDNQLPVLIVNDILNVVDPRVIAEQKFTQPPSRYREPTLIKELEDRGIGRPSTYATIMNKICETRNFVEKKNDILHPTESGIKVSDLLSKYFTFMQYDFTVEMEKKLDLIEQGKYTYIKTMKDFYNPFKAELDKAYADYECDTEYTCNLCTAPMILKRSSFGYFLGCSAYPKCKNIINCQVIEDKIVIKPKEYESAPKDIKCPLCNGDMVIRNGQFGDYYSCKDYPNCKGSRKKPFGKKCPNCNSDLFRTVFYKPPIMGAVLCCTSYPKCNYIEQLDEPDYKEKKRAIAREMKQNSKKFKSFKIQ